jgi:hypothetical protein
MTATLAIKITATEAGDFFSARSWDLILNLSILFLAVFWIATGYWVYKDARRRIEDPWLIGTATVLGLFPPFFGAVIYMLFRPPEYLDEVHERELEIKEMEMRLGKRSSRCPVCQVEVDPSYLVCPVCTTRLKQPCSNCKAPLEPLWQICPYCETAVASAPIQEDTWEKQPRVRKSR